MLTRRSTRTLDSGSAIVLFPVGVLVVIVLAAIAVDTAAVHLTHQRALDAATAAADDAVAAALDVDRYRACGGWHLNHAKAHHVARSTISARGLGDQLVDLELRLGTDELTVVVAVRSERIYGRALGGDRHRVVRATGTATVTRR
jgi:Flp pilus assembly protein TadG